jgi:hypothetical protein
MTGFVSGSGVSWISRTGSNLCMDVYQAVVRGGVGGKPTMMHAIPHNNNNVTACPPT